MEELLRPLLRPVRERMRAISTLRALCAVLLCGTLAAGFVWWAGLRWQQTDPHAATWLFWIVVAGCGGALLLARLRHRDWRSVAARVERRFPSLKQRLFAALDQRPDAAGLRFHALQQQLHKEVVAHARRYRWPDAVSSRNLWAHRIAALVCFAAFAFVLMQLRQLPSRSVELADTAGSASPSGAVRIEPGDIDLEKGSPLTVVATFPMPVPRSVQLELESDSETSSREMRRNLDDPSFAAMIPAINSDSRYRVAFDGRGSQSYRVTVFEYPQMLRSDAELTFPDYTQLPQKRIDDTRRVTAVEGTSLRWLLTLNKPVTVAELIPEKGEALALEQDPDNPLGYFVDVPLRESQRWTVRLIDDAKRENKNPVELSVKVLPNAPPEIKLVSARDYSVSPLEELSLGATARDDFGLLKMGIAYEIAGGAPREEVLVDSSSRSEKEKAGHLLALEQLDAQPDQLLSYYFWAEDIGPDGQLRRTASDMYFAEIRPFEEIYREGQSPPGGSQQQQGSQAGQQAEELAELQKQIISATWRVIRDAEAGTLDPAKPFADVGLLIESQRTALQSLDQLAGQVQAPEAGRTVEEIREFMQQSLTSLERSFGTDSADPLPDALSAQQAAYQSLLKLRAREFQVSRSQQSRGGSSSGAQRARQQQLEQLELEEDPSRYETQQQAQETPEEAQAREDRQILSRLRELARRQEDLNERLKQLQNALKAAKDEEEREQIERQLRRLREQQEELLRDTDELAQRLESDNRESTQQASDQLQETRENVQQAAESLRQQDASSALTAGTRAERRFEQMRDDFRDATSSQFREAMEQMQQQAEQLEEQQQELGRELAESGQQEESAGLRRQNGSDQLREQLAEQRESLDQLLESMEQTVRDAEESEPLLAEQLFDAHRSASAERVGDRLEQTREALRRGMMPEARQLEQAAREGIRNLREQIDNAAESVLGNRAEALRRAEQELERLSRELNEEIETNDPQGATGAQQQSASAPGRREQADDAESQTAAGQEGEAQDSQSQQSGERSGRSQDQQPQEGQPQQQGEGQDQQPQDAQRQQGGGQQPQQGQPSGSQQQQQQSSPSGGSQSQSESESQSQNESESQSQSDSQSQGGSSSGDNDARRSDRRPGLREQAGPQTRGQTGGEARNQRGGGLEGLNFGEVPLQPLTGDDFRDWSDRLRDVEEMVEDPELRNRAAAIRDRARAIRAEVTRHSREPQWPLVREMIAIPLEELRRDVAIELRRESAERNALVPVDRDPVPAQYDEAVRTYYERLGSGQ